jgi:hypothetical protein
MRMLIMFTIMRSDARSNYCDGVRSIHSRTSSVTPTGDLNKGGGPANQDLYWLLCSEYLSPVYSVVRSERYSNMGGMRVR